MASTGAYSLFSGILNGFGPKGANAQNPVSQPGAPNNSNSPMDPKAQMEGDLLRQQAMSRGAISGSEGGQAGMINPTASNVGYYSGQDPALNAALRQQAWERSANSLPVGQMGGGGGMPIGPSGGGGF